jgi:hypothetical protein
MTELQRQRVLLEARLRAAPADPMSDDAIRHDMTNAIRHDITKERL